MRTNQFRFRENRKEYSLCSKATALLLLWGCVGISTLILRLSLILVSHFSQGYLFCLNCKIISLSNNKLCRTLASDSHRLSALGNEYIAGRPRMARCAKFRGSPAFLNACSSFGCSPRSHKVDRPHASRSRRPESRIALHRKSAPFVEQTKPELRGILAIRKKTLLPTSISRLAAARATKINAARNVAPSKSPVKAKRKK